MKSKITKLISFVIIIAALVYFFYPLMSFAVMGIYSAEHANISVMRQNGFKIDIPSGKGWYPFVLTYNAAGFPRFSGIEADMSIMYNFGAFDLSTRTSSIYDKSSDKYSSFYGAYVVKQNDSGIFGFDENGAADINEIGLAVEYDYTKLVIEDFGCKEQTFKIDDYVFEENCTFAETEGWTRIDAVLTTNGTAHNFDGFKTPYLQYGKPMSEVEKDFEITKLYGRVYSKYLEEYGCTVMAYVIAPNMEAVKSCERDILSETTIAPLS